MMEQAGMEPNTEVNSFDPEEVKSRGNYSADPADTAVGTATSKAEPSDD